MGAFSVHITRHYPTIYIYCTEVACIYPSVSKVHAGSFRVSVILWTLTWTVNMCTWPFCHLTEVSTETTACVSCWCRILDEWNHTQTQRRKKNPSFFCLSVEERTSNSRFKLGSIPDISNKYWGVHLDEILTMDEQSSSMYVLSCFSVSPKIIVMVCWT